jgi:hypothetical protein
MLEPFTLKVSANLTASRSLNSILGRGGNLCAKLIKSAACANALSDKMESVTYTEDTIYIVFYLLL